MSANGLHEVIAFISCKVNGELPAGREKHERKARLRYEAWLNGPQDGELAGSVATSSFHRVDFRYPWAKTVCLFIIRKRQEKKNEYGNSNDDRSGERKMNINRKKNFQSVM